MQTRNEYKNFRFSVNKEVICNIFKKCSQIADLYGIYWPTVLYEDLQIPFYSCLAARILLRMHNQGKVLPESEKEQITILRNIRTDMAGRPRRGDPMNDTNSSSSGSVGG